MRKVWVNGCFDVLHMGHLKLLEFASTLGDMVFVGIDSDARIRQFKGSDRPVNNQEFRKHLLESLVYVEKVYVFDTDHQLSEYIRQLNPWQMVIGSDYMGKKIIGAEHCANVTFFQRIGGLSTSETIKKIKNGKRAKID
jgi:D-beta-D-heptose 7-phosphate kinase/D-beta-D-heptose 1-phosphate adenosyltransferase